MLGIPIEELLEIGNSSYFQFPINRLTCQVEASVRTSSKQDRISCEKEI